MQLVELMASPYTRASPWEGGSTPAGGEGGGAGAGREGSTPVEGVVAGEGGEGGGEQNPCQEITRRH